MPENYTVNSDVVLSADVKLKVKKIADAYFKATQKTIVVTSGTRSSSSQAEAMHGKLAGGDQLAVYRDQKSVKEIKKAYEDAKKAKKSQPEIIKAMQSVIDGQIKKGVYISRHLRAGAIDVRSKDMSATEKVAFKKAAAGVAKVVILETIPPHWHLEL